MWSELRISLACSLLGITLSLLVLPVERASARVANCDFDYRVISLDPKERVMLTRIIHEYRAAGSAFKNENLKHIRRMVKRARNHREELAAYGIDASAFELALYISDMAKSPHIIQQFMHKYGDDFFTTFMDHSKISMQLANRMRREMGIPNDRWQRIVRGVIGHDGPSTRGSFWGETYPALLGKPYADLVSPEGVLHAIMDRIDQGGLFKQANGQLDGGMRKISFDVMNGIAPTPHRGNLAATVRYTFENIHKNTYPQLRDLDENIVPRFFPNGVPPFIQELRREFEQSYDYLSRVSFDENNSDIVYITMDSGARVEVNSLDQFWAILSRVNIEQDVQPVNLANPRQTISPIRVPTGIGSGFTDPIAIPAE